MLPSRGRGASKDAPSELSPHQPYTKGRGRGRFRCSETLRTLVFRLLRRAGLPFLPCIGAARQFVGLSTHEVTRAQYWYFGDADAAFSSHKLRESGLR